ncbi:GcrA family cell cycle regulator [Acidisphaera sp. L21]|jgi:GcrA cell cycle regulator|uniref:GcrA family cell cycle regulator n=1 Tax=Acidisphaera sp. L21 TaxID=1641851 RepID=UPI00131BB2B5|nr:GcrA family cell cycle regulator [Acidisphaera sp. L21]
MDWTDEIIDRLKTLWAEGVSTAEIGRRIGVSKNAVVGKAHRLSLAARPSPIRRGAPGEAPKRSPVRRVVGPTLPTMAPPPPVEVRPPVAVAPRPVPTPSPAPVLRAVHRAPGGRLVACCWPIGEPGTRSFRFCDDESLPGKPYCSTHAALAYVKVRDRREEAA